jgi:UDP-glucose 4-epimerase
VRVLVTGAAGWLGRALVPRLRGDGHFVIGLDPVASPTTSVVGTIEDRPLVRELLRGHEVDAIVHGGALHKPHVTTHAADRFLSVNVQGTLNLLEEAVAEGSRVTRFVFTSTTSLMISREIREGRANGRRAAAWITEDLAPLQPRNIYGVSKLSAEHLCRLFHELPGLPLLILRTSRFFSRSGRHGAHHRAVRAEYEVQRATVSSLDGRRRGGGARARTARSRATGLDDVRLDRSRVRRDARGGASRLRS